MYSFSLLVPVNVNLFLFEFRILIIFSFVILILNGCDFDLYPYDWNCRININYYCREDPREHQNLLSLWPMGSIMQMGIIQVYGKVSTE